MLDLIDGAVYTSEVPWTKPAPEAFLAAMDAVGVTDPAACVFVGDRLFDDIWGARAVGMRTVFIRRGPWGYLHALKDEAALADLRVDSLHELAILLGADRGR